MISPRKEDEARDRPPLLPLHLRRSVASGMLDDGRKHKSTKTQSGKFRRLCPSKNQVAVKEGIPSQTVGSLIYQGFSESDLGQVVQSGVTKASPKTPF